MNQKQQEVLAAVCAEFNLVSIKSLDSGAFKQAYLAELNGLPVALKIAPISGELRDRFEREVVALEKCNHSSIARILSSGSLIFEGGEYWVILEEYLPFGTLAQRTEKTQLGLEETKHLGIVISHAISHLHELKLVHRDIKPANIIFRTDSEPVLTDFGIVRMLDETSLTQSFLGQGPGTPKYASPEQLLNEKASIDWRTDQFCLALVLSEQILGHHAFSIDSHSNIHDAITRVIGRQEVPILNQVLLRNMGFGCLIKAMSPWAVQRFRKPEDFINELEGVVTNG